MCTELNVPRFTTLLHLAVHFDAPLSVLEFAVSRFGYLLHVRDGLGRRPIDLARKLNRPQLNVLLHPWDIWPTHVDRAEREELERQIHSIMLQSIFQKRMRNDIILPQIDVLMAFPGRRWFVPIPGCYGGFGLEITTERKLLEKIQENHSLPDSVAAPDVTHLLVDGGESLACLADSFVRICGGSEKYHYVTTKGGVEVPQYSSQ